MMHIAEGQPIMVRGILAGPTFLSIGLVQDGPVKYDLDTEFDPWHHRARRQNPPRDKRISKRKHEEW